MRRGDTNVGESRQPDAIDADPRRNREIQLPTWAAPTLRATSSGTVVTGDALIAWTPFIGDGYPRSDRADPNNSRFALDDSLLRFWFRFVFPNTSSIAQMGAERAWRDRIRPDLDADFGACFEALCRAALPHL